MRISSVKKRKMEGGRRPWSQSMTSVEGNLPWHGWAKYVSKMYQKYVSPLYRTDTRVLYAANSQIQRPPSEFFQCTRKACHNTVDLNVCIMEVITELHIQICDGLKYNKTPPKNQTVLSGLELQPVSVLEAIIHKEYMNKLISSEQILYTNAHEDCFSLGTKNEQFFADS